MKTLFSEYKMGRISLKNRIVMAPMTRSRCVDNAPGELVEKYYEQRAEAGLIITEGTSPSPDGLGYPRIPGIFTAAQTAAWKRVGEKVHGQGSKIFVQLMHTGRVGHPLNLPDGAKVVAPSAVAVSGEMYTDSDGPKQHPVPAQMSEAEIQKAIEEFADAADNAVNGAGLDGVEIHGANGYLVDQFLNIASNQRDDQWGGSVENRARFALQVAESVAKRVGADRTGIRLSPYGVFNDMQPDEDMDALYRYLTVKLSELGIAYVHVVDHSSMGAPSPNAELVTDMRRLFSNTFILSGGYDAQRAENDLSQNKGDLVAFGRPFIANPNLPTALQKNVALSAPNFDLFYTPGPEGYVDYPAVAG